MKEEQKVELVNTIKDDILKGYEDYQSQRIQTIEEARKIAKSWNN